jgi:hypothetical protein
MRTRPSELADLTAMQRPETFILPVSAARNKAREILDQFPQGGYMTVIENWRQLPDGYIEFAMRQLPIAD